MKILALNSSPHSGGQSKTELMLNHLVEGMRDAGAEVEVVNLRQKAVKNCIGCYTCWTKTPGRCIHKDDMTNELFPKWLKSELVVYATPLYNFTMNAEMKVFFERCLPALEPFIELRDNRTAHPWRQAPSQAVVLSVAGFPEMSVFEQLSNYVKFLFGRSDALWAEIYRPAAESLSMIEDKKEEVLKATVQAGRELVKSRRVSVETLARIQQPIIDFPTFAQIGNLFWKSCIDEGVTPKEFQEKKMVPRPNSIKDFMILLPLGLNIEAAGKKTVILQFKFSGDLKDSCYFVIENGNVDAKEGTQENPDITIETPFELWMDIITGKADGQQMFREQKYKVNGNLVLMIQLFQKESDPG
ncbi:MAG: NAD(P)H-dependent oxidoreductase [Deltaproteobacteria bacterium]|nr:MAG: NAD(P)H-dependent oxidoreductase [Deltaproteobacteria bacterium]